MQEMKEIAAALFKFQQEVGKVRKDATNPFFKSKYATLSNILEVIKEPLEKCKLVVFQAPSNYPSLLTTIIHIDSGEFIESNYPLRPVKEDPQGIGSAITYARRYALVSMLCLDVDDDDGNAASKPTTSEQQAFKEQVQGTQKPRIVPAKIITEGPARQEQLKLIEFYINKLGKSGAGILIDYSISELKDLTSKQAVEVINSLEKE